MVPNYFDNGINYFLHHILMQEKILILAHKFLFYHFHLVNSKFPIFLFLEAFLLGFLLLLN